MARNPRRGPSRQPASITPSDCSVIGTPNGRSIFGIRPNTAISAANSAMYDRERDEVREPVVVMAFAIEKKSESQRPSRAASASATRSAVCSVRMVSGASSRSPPPWPVRAR
jgi:hypothetical protein